MLYDPKWEAETRVAVEPWRQVLLDAAGIIRKNGHVKEMLRSEDGYCIIGAILQAGEDDPLALYGGPLEGDKKVASERLASYLARERGAKNELWASHTICIWNNALDRTKAEVLAALEDCARRG
jgi:hypothetical protein